MSDNNSSSLSLPPTYRALQFHSASEPATIITKPSPSLPPPNGTIILKVLQAGIVSYTNEIFQNGNPRSYSYPLPFVPGPSCIARIAAVPPDAPGLKTGQLVVLEPTIRARDHEAHGGAEFLLGFHGGRGLSYGVMENVWRDGCFAEVVSAPVENVHVLDEDVLFGRRHLGYQMRDLGALLTLAVPFGGLDAVQVRPGETVIVAPSTGSFGGAAVHVALALGAKVIAMGRNEAILAALEALDEGKVAGAKLSGSVDGDIEGIQAAAAKLGSKAVDVFFEISPPNVVDGSGQTVPYITAAIKSLRKGGRAVFMGGIKHEISLPIWEISHLQKTLQGWWMYTPKQVKDLIRLVESGQLRMGESRGFRCTGAFPLERWDDAFETAAKQAKIGNFAVLQLNKE